MILVAGSANLDFVVRSDHIPRPGETVLGRDFKTFPGGKGANQAVACARAGGVPTQMLLGLGNDAFATPLETSLQGAGVQMHIVRDAEQATGTAFICLSAAGENAITVAPGANSALRPQHLPPLEGFSHLLLQLEIPLDTVTAYAAAARAAGVQVVLNAAPARVLPPELLALVDILLVNEGELATVSQCPGTVAQCLERLQVPTVVVTLGARGCCARHLGGMHVQAAYVVKPIDTTAAGDTFCGAFSAALSLGHAMPDALRYACAAGALACTRMGAQSSIPPAAEVLALVSQQADVNNPGELAALRSLCGLNE
ncbi:MAG: ribokinase [Rhodoferax sp.]|nr:ribokinase [Rhodoferax sp.]